METCAYHDGHEHRIGRNEKDIQDLFQDLKDAEDKTDEGLKRVHGRIDTMKTSIISAMFVVIVQGVLLALKFVIG